MHGSGIWDKQPQCESSKTMEEKIEDVVKNIVDGLPNLASLQLMTYHDPSQSSEGCDDCGVHRGDEWAMSLRYVNVVKARSQERAEAAERQMIARAIMQNERRGVETGTLNPWLNSMESERTYSEQALKAKNVETIATSIFGPPPPGPDIALHNQSSINRVITAGKYVPPHRRNRG